MMQFIIGLGILQVKKVVLEIVLISKIRTDSYSSLPIKKTLTFHNIMILIKSVFNENKNHYYYNRFLEKRFI